MEYEDEMSYTNVELAEEMETESIFSTNRQRQPDTNILRKKLDNGYYRYHLLNESGQKCVAETYFTDMVPGNPIRNAINGDRMYEYKVGSPYESLFFKVCDACGFHSSGPMTFYYNSPEQYERHLNIELPFYVKEKWIEENMYARKTLRGLA